MSEPAIKRVVAFFDGQNLFHASREAFGYLHPNFCPLRLTTKVCADKGWNLQQIRFYTGVPDQGHSQFWSQFWTSKLGAMGHQWIVVFSRLLRYRNQVIKLPDGTIHTALVGEEKGIDVRIALDIISLAHKEVYDVALVFSQDQDLSEVAKEIRTIAREQNRWLRIASAFPTSPTSPNRRGINDTDWIRLDRATYDACLDPRDYRPKR